MRNELEAEKRQTAKAEDHAKQLTEMLEQAREGYKRLYAICDLVLQTEDEAGKDDVPGWFLKLCESVRAAMIEAEKYSPFISKGEAAEAADYCRVCGRPIIRTNPDEAYCQICSRSSMTQVEEPLEAKPVETDA